MSLVDFASSPIFSGVVGGIGSIVTGVLGYFQKKEDNKFALIRMDKERDLLAVQANIDQAKYAALLTFQQQKGADDAFTASQQSEIRPSQGGRKIAALRESVRPILTYAYQLMFFVILALALTAWWNKWCAESDVLPLIQYMVVALINCATMSFSWWFGQRQIDKVSVAWGNKTAGASVSRKAAS